MNGSWGASISVRFRAVRTGLAVACVSLALAGCGSQAGVDEDSSPTLPRPNMAAPLSSPGVPCRGAEVASPAVVGAAAKASGISTYLPSGVLATVDKAWTCGSSPMPFFMINGVQLSVEPGWDGVDANAHLAAFTAEFGGRVAEVQGYPAVLAPANENQLYNEVLIIRGSVAITLLSRGSVPFSRVVEVANDLDLTANDRGDTKPPPSA